MYGVSSDFLTAIHQSGRTFKSAATIIKTGYANLLLDDTQIMSINLFASTISGENFEIGTTCAAEFDIEITNIDGSLTSAAFQDASITASIGVLLADGVTYEYCPLGVFYVDSISKTETSIRLKCYDAMIKLETLYRTDLMYPKTLLQIAQDIAAKAGLALANTTFPNAAFSVSTAPTLAGVTLRSAISWVAEAAGCFARIDRSGKLDINFYVSSGQSITADNYFTLTHDEQSRAAITQVTIKQSDTDIGVNSGSVGNTYTITGNPLLAHNPSGALTAIYAQLNGFTYMPFQADWQGNPALMAGDALTITDRNSNSYTTILTESDITYEGGLMGTAVAKSLSAQAQTYQTATPVASAASSVAQAVSDQQTINNLLAGNITATNIAAGSLTADRMTTGTITAASGIITNAAIGTAQIADASIINAKIGTSAIATANIQTAAITNALIGNAAISTANIQTGAITTALIDTAAIGTTQIADGSITDAKIVTLTANKIAAGTIDASKITVTNLNCANLTVGTINGTQIASATLTSSNIVDGTIQGSDIKSGTITNTLISATTITGDRLVAGTITASQIAAATITGNNIAANTITAGNISSGTITATQIAANTITASQLAANTITGAQIAAGTITADKINATNLSVVKLNSSAGYYVEIEPITYGAGQKYGVAVCDNTNTVQTFISMSEIGGNSSFMIKGNYGDNLSMVDGVYIKLDSSTGVITLNSSASVIVSNNLAVGGVQNFTTTTYPQLYGNGSVLQLSYANNSTSGVIIQSGVLRIAGDANYTLGNASHRWSTVYSSSATISTSDRNEKNTIEPLDEVKSVAFILALTPVSYIFNNGTNGRIHYGMIAQDVEDEMTALGMTSADFAGFIKSPKTDEDGNDISAESGYTYGLRYEEFIAPLIKTVQCINSKINDLETLLAALDSKAI